MFITADNVDPDLQHPYADIDERRTAVDPATGRSVPYRYIHGGFAESNARFSLYFPSPEDYRGRFFQSTYPTSTVEDADPATVLFCIVHGAYAVSTNNAGGIMVAGHLAGYRVNAAAAKYSKVVAADIYGPGVPTRGYLYGASGGGLQTLGAAENTSGIWEGTVPMVPGVPNAIPSFMASQAMALRVLERSLPQIVDALEPGGSGDPYATLNDAETAAFNEVTRLGFPPRAWWYHARMSGGALAVVGGGVRMIDPTYVTDFWSLPGYAGADDSEVIAARCDIEATVVAVNELPPPPPEALFPKPAKSLTLSLAPTGALMCADLTMTSGAASGRSATIGGIDGTEMTFASGTDASFLNKIQPGDTVRIDNSWSLALQYYSRHQVPSIDQYGWNQYRDADGTALYPQRALLVGPLMTGGAAGGSPTTGRFHGKMIMLASLLDMEAYPWSTDWYRGQATAVIGADMDDRYRLWLTDNAEHAPWPKTSDDTHLVTYVGVMEQALLDLDDWVALGVVPPATSAYQIDEMSQIQVPPTAPERLGIQPVIALTANGAHDVITVASGAPVELVLTAEVPPDAGKIVRIEWSLDGSGTFAGSPLADPSATVHTTQTLEFLQPGTVFVIARVTSHREGDTACAHRLIRNMIRFRVIVEE